ncbi:Xaa-Pro peptidase family protein [Actinomadura madurae]|uniref:Creatinase/Prolidase N-terminal domain-containing protein n=1 Tax=Actinomadura madurae TaxID=1993 RepID=A0A1I5DJK6_9ACTN|nr:Xaa-Pro peptidase family protein [Actinomadura madurae]SFN99429.1 Creatinase/Prolidase N-terminal domain-containing protein [Actinomadura madurae]
MSDTAMQRRDPSFYGGDELHAWKQSRLQDAMAEHGFDALVFTKSEAVRYVTDFYVKGYRPFMDPEYFVVLPAGRAPVVGHTSGSDTYRIQIKSDIADHRKISGVENWAAELSAVLGDYGITHGRIGVDLLPFQVHAGLLERHPSLEVVDATWLWTELTAIKHPIEIEYIREALSLVEIGLYASFEAIRPGVVERDVAVAAESAMRAAGSEMQPFMTVVASGPNASMFERIATERRIRTGEMVVVDMGAVYRGYTGDLGRTVCVGPPAPRQREVYQVAYESIQAAISAVRPGVTCADVDRAAREAIAARGYADYEHKFSTGHQLGWGLHGEPLINRGVDHELRPGMVICLEPRVTLFDEPEIGGAHLEEAVLVTENGHELLSHCRFEEALLN